MYLYKKSISEVKRILADEVGLICAKKNGFYIYDKLIEEVEGNFFGEMYFHKKDILILQCFNGYFYIIIKNGILLKKVEGYYLTRQNSSDDIFFQDLKLNSICKLSGDLVINTGIARFVFLLNNSYLDIADDGSNIEVFDIVIKKDDLETNTKNLLWQFSFSSLGVYIDGASEKEYKLQEFCGSYDSKLVVTVSSSEVVMINAKNGELVQHFKGIYCPYGLRPNQEGSNIYWCIYSTNFTEIDIDKGEVIRRLSLEEELMRHHAQDPSVNFYITINKSVIYNGLIYFYTRSNQIGVFSPTEEKIIWFHQMDIGNKTANFFTDIQVNDANIYVLDYAGTLHIFEKNNTINKLKKIT